MDSFSPSAINCGCAKRFTEWHSKFFPAPENPLKKKALLAKFDEKKKNKLGYAWVTLKFKLAKNKFKLDDDSFYDKERALWHDKSGMPVIYEKSVNDWKKEIEASANDQKRKPTWKPEDVNIIEGRCDHLKEQIKKTFSIEVTDPKWNHWNGGVFLFDDQSAGFLNAWHERTIYIFGQPEWKTRDQGTLIATVWESGLQDHPTLPIAYNFIADYNKKMDHLGDLRFKLEDVAETIEPFFLHVFHHWNDKKWDVWQAVERRTGLVADATEHTIHSLWIGTRLSNLELLTIKSFIANGHTFKLWLYDELETDLPDEVEIGDASTIIPRDQIFAYQNENKYGHGKGSYAGFSDIFRYKLLYDHGGWWVDMDITCLRPFDFREPYFFRSHHQLSVVGNVMKCPRHSELMKHCYEEALLTINESNTDWHKPIEILNKHIKSLQLLQYIKSNVSNPDQWHKTNRFIRHNDAIPKEWYFIHWQNEEWRSKKISKEAVYYRSALAALMQKYSLLALPSSLIGKMKNTIKYYYFQ
jgi:hypothetical protein